MMEQKTKRIVHIDDREDDRSLVDLALKKLGGLELIQFGDLESFDKSFRDIKADLYIFDGQFPSNSESHPVYNWHNATKLVTDFNQDSKILIFSGNPPSVNETNNYSCIKGVCNKNTTNILTHLREFVRPYI